MAREPNQRSRAHLHVSPESLATYTAAKGFLISEWIGAVLMLASFTQLYVFILGPFDTHPAWVVGAGLMLLAVGGWMFWTSRRTYLALDFPWKRGWEVAATVVAASGAVFWFMFALAWWLTVRGVRILGD